MRNLFPRILFPLFFAATPVALANPDISVPTPPDVLAGTIEIVTCGELDPFELGDACVVYGITLNGAAIGLVTTDLGLVDDYGYDGLEALAGQPLTLPTDTLRALDDVAVLTVLNSLPFSDVEGRRFFWWDGSGILGK